MERKCSVMHCNVLLLYILQIVGMEAQDMYREYPEVNVYNSK